MVRIMAFRRSLTRDWGSCAHGAMREAWIFALAALACNASAPPPEAPLIVAVGAAVSARRDAVGGGRDALSVRGKTFPRIVTAVGGGRDALSVRGKTFPCIVNVLGEGEEAFDSG